MDFTKIYSLVQANFGIICMILLLILSEILAFKPALGSSGVVKLIYSILKGEAKKAQPEVVKIIESDFPSRSDSSSS